MTMDEIFKTMQDLIAEQFAIDTDEIGMDSSFVPRIGASSLYPLLPGHHRPEFGTRSVLPELGGRVASYAGKRA